MLASHRKDRTRPSRNDRQKMRHSKRRLEVERSSGWLHNYRRMLVRHEYDSHPYDGFIPLACAVIAIGQLCNEMPVTCLTIFAAVSTISALNAIHGEAAE